MPDASRRPVPAERVEPRRQARGQRRIEQILHAAAEVFAEQGYEGATTNAIAAAAGVSPGSLYQFFKNKDAIARALADLYVAELGAAQTEAFGGAEPPRAPLEAVVERVVDTLVAFNLAHPGFKALFARTDMPAGLSAAVAPIHESIHRRVRALVRALVPGLDDAALERTTTVAIQLVRAMMPLIVSAPPRERPALVGDLRAVLVGYLGEAGAKTAPDPR